jgi:hypothetical protein
VIRLTPPLQCGFFAGIILLIAFGAATDYSVQLLIDLGVINVLSLFVLPLSIEYLLQLRHRVRSYSDLCEKVRSPAQHSYCWRYL